MVYLHCLNFLVITWGIYKLVLFLRVYILSTCGIKRESNLSKIFIYLFIIIIFLLYNIVLVLPYFSMYTCSQSWTPLPPKIFKFIVFSTTSTHKSINNKYIHWAPAVCISGTVLGTDITNTKRPLRLPLQICIFVILQE